MTNSNNFEIKKKIVLAGDSKIFNNWKEHSSITIEDFLEALEWVCNDPFDNRNRRTRYIGLEPTRIVKIKAFYKDNKFTGDSFVTYIDIDTISDPLHSAWEGKIFKDGFVHKIMLSARDKV